MTFRLLSCPLAVAVNQRSCQCAVQQVWTEFLNTFSCEGLGIGLAGDAHRMVAIPSISQRLSAQNSGLTAAAKRTHTHQGGIRFPILSRRLALARAIYEVCAMQHICTFR